MAISQNIIIAENILKIISEITKEKIDTYFYEIIIKLFGDHAEEIRKIRNTLWKIIEKLFEMMDKDFMEKQIWEAQKEQMKHKSYILRISAMKSIDYLKKLYNKEFIINTIIPYIIDNVKKDKIPNVKFSACEFLASLVIFINKEKNTKKMQKILFVIILMMMMKMWFSLVKKLSMNYKNKYYLFNIYFKI